MLYVPVPYDPAWPDLFEAYRADIVALTGLSRGCIHHIGSTAVRGLSAKPIIDIQIGVPDLDTFDLSRLSGRGFAPAPEIDRDDPFPDERAGYGGWRKKYARLERDNRRLAHVHVRQMGAPNYRFALLMRDYLRHSEMARELYADFKCAAAQVASETSDPGGTGGYLALKDPFVKLLGVCAESWAGQSGWIPPEAAA